MRILYLTQWFDPEPAFKGRDFAAALAAQGHEVHVATGFPNYPSGKVYDGYRLRMYQRETVGAVRLHRLWLWPSHDASSLGRSLNYLSFFISALLYGLLRARRYDVVYVYHPPITPGLAAALFCALWRRPYVIDIQDLWPDSVVASKMASEWTARVLSGLCDFVYSRATRIIVQSDGMSAALLERGVPAGKVTRIYNWSTYTRRDQSGDRSPTLESDPCVNVVYGGNIGQAQSLEVLVEAAAEASRSEPNLRLSIFGGGVERDKIIALANKMDNSISVRTSLSRQDMDRVFDQADILALHLADDPLYDITLPSKIQHYLSCGKPIVAGINGEGAKMLKESGAAKVSPSGDVAGMAANLVALVRLSAAERRSMGAKGAEYYRANLAFEDALDRTLNIVIEATGGMS